MLLSIDETCVQGEKRKYKIHVLGINTFKILILIIISYFYFYFHNSDTDGKMLGIFLKLRHCFSMRESLRRKIWYTLIWH